MNHKLQRICALPAALLLMGAAAAGAAQKPQSKLSAQLGARMERRYKDLQGLSQTVKTTFDIKGPGDTLTATLNTRVLIARPGKFRIETTVEWFAEEFHRTLVCDGKTLWEYDPDSKAYTEQPASVIPRSSQAFGNWCFSHGVPDFSMAFFMGGSDGKSGAVKEDPIKAGFERVTTKKLYGRPAYVVQMGGLRTEAGAGNIALYFDAQDLLLRLARGTFLPPKKQTRGLSLTMTLTCNHSDIMPNPTVDVAFFEFNPPEDAERVDRMTPVFQKALSAEKEDR